MKKDYINNEMLKYLLPNEKEYSCSSIDRVVNLPNRPKLSENDLANMSKTGNLPTILKIKVGAPVVITSNHPKAKYKDDGIMNGARGYVQAVQTSSNDSSKLEIISRKALPWAVLSSKISVKVLSAAESRPEPQIAQFRSFTENAFLS